MLAEELVPVQGDFPSLTTLRPYNERPSSYVSLKGKERETAYEKRAARMRNTLLSPLVLLINLPPIIFH